MSEGRSQCGSFIDTNPFAGYCSRPKSAKKKPISSSGLLKTDDDNDGDDNDDNDDDDDLCKHMLGRGIAPTTYFFLLQCISS